MAATIEEQRDSTRASVSFCVGFSCSLLRLLAMIGIGGGFCCPLFIVLQLVMHIKVVLILLVTVQCESSEGVRATQVRLIVQVSVLSVAKRFERRWVVVLSVLDLPFENLVRNVVQ